MSVKLYENLFALRDPDTNQMVPVGMFLSGEFPSEEAMKDYAESIKDGVAIDVRDTIMSSMSTELQNAKDSMLAAIAAGTDTTLAIQGAPADSKTVGDELDAIKQQITNTPSSGPTVDVADGETPAAINLRKLGATGNSSQDVTSIIQTAVNSFDHIYFPPGTYKITSRITLRDNIRIIGNGATLLCSGCDGLYLGNSKQYSNITIEGLNIQGSNATATMALYFYGVKNLTIRRCRFSGFPLAGIYSMAAWVNDDILIEDCYFTDMAFGISMQPYKNVMIRGCKFVNLKYSYAAIGNHNWPPHAIYLRSDGKETYLTDYPEKILLSGVYYGVGDNATVDHCYFDTLDCGTSSIAHPYAIKINSVPDALADANLIGVYNHNTLINNCEFVNYECAIQAGYTENVRVLNNRMECGSTRTTVPNRVLRFDACKDIVIDSNHIYNDSHTVTAEQFTMLFLHSGLTDVIIRNNDITNVSGKMIFYKRLVSSDTDAKISFDVYGNKFTHVLSDSSANADYIMSLISTASRISFRNNMFVSPRIGITVSSIADDAVIDIVNNAFYASGKGTVSKAYGINGDTTDAVVQTGNTFVGYLASHSGKSQNDVDITWSAGNQVIN